MNRYPRRMLFVSWIAGLGGSQHTTHMRMRALRDLGVQSEILFHKPGPALSAFAEFPTYVSNCTSKQASIVQKGRYDLIATVNTAAILDALPTIHYPGLVVYELRSIENRRSRRGCRKAIAKWKQVTQVIAISQFIAAYVKRKAGDTPLPVKVITNTVDASLFRPMTNPDRRLVPGPLVPHTPIVLWVGRVEKNKNWRELLRILRILRTSGRNVQFWLVADTTRSRSLRKMEGYVAAHGLVKWVKLIPCVPFDQMPHLYAFARQSGGVVVSTSRNEGGFQGSLLEGMACGCPVICSEIPGNLELIVDHRNGRTYPLGKPHLAAALIAELLDNKSQWEKLSKSGLDEIHRHSPERKAQEFLNAIGVL